MIDEVILLFALVGGIVVLYKTEKGFEKLCYKTERGGKGK